MNTGLLSVSIFTMSVLAGCTAPIVYEGQYDYKDGWRTGKVLSTGEAIHRVSTSQRDCRAQRGDDLPATRFAYVRQRSPLRHSKFVVLSPPNAVIKRGDLIYFKVGDCRTPLVLRATSSVPKSPQ